METNVLQTLRYKLQKRLKRVNTANFQIFHSVVSQTFGFLVGNPVVKGILDDLERRVPSAHENSQRLFEGTLLTGETELEYIALCYGLLKRTVASDQNKEIGLGHVFGRNSKHQEAAADFTELFIEPLFDYLDEQIDDRRTLLGLLLKYKHHVEWFERDALRAAFESDTTRGERTLSRHLYAFLHNQGIEFSIEPSSISGEVDLISAQTGADRLIADVKIFDPARSKGLSYLSSGFAQVYQYAKDYNDPFGYLVVFKTCREDLSINARDQETAIPFFTHNNKTVFVLVVDLCAHAEPASKRGHLKSYELVESEVVRTVAESSPSSSTAAKVDGQDDAPQLP